MTTLYASLQHLVDRVPSLDWMHASWFVSDALRPAADLLDGVAPALDWIDGLPVVGPVLFSALFDPWVLLRDELAILGTLLTAVVMLGSGALHALVESRVNSVTEFFDAIQLFARLVRGS
jgi:hypothetical protein